MTIVFRLDYVDQQLQRLLQIVDYADNQQRTLRTVDLTPTATSRSPSAKISNPHTKYQSLCSGKITQYRRRT